MAAEMSGSATWSAAASPTSCSFLGRTAVIVPERLLLIGPPRCADHDRWQPSTCALAWNGTLSRLGGAVLFTLKRLHGLPYPRYDSILLCVARDERSALQGNATNSLSVELFASGETRSRDSLNCTKLEGVMAQLVLNKRARIEICGKFLEREFLFPLQLFISVWFCRACPCVIAAHRSVRRCHVEGSIEKPV